MTQLTLTISIVPSGQPNGEPVDDPSGHVSDSPGDVLDALSDSVSRAILSALAAEPLTASELAEACGMALSTTYRKVDELAEIGLLEDHVRIRTSGNNAREFSVRPTLLQVTLAPSGDIDLERSLVTHRARVGASSPPASTIVADAIEADGGGKESGHTTRGTAGPLGVPPVEEPGTEDDEDDQRSPEALRVIVDATGWYSRYLRTAVPDDGRSDGSGESDAGGSE